MLPFLPFGVVQDLRRLDLPAASARFGLSIEMRTNPSEGDAVARGPADITITDRRRRRPIQRIHLATFALFPDGKSLDVAAGGRSPDPYGVSYSAIFQDVDFDGNPDLAFCTGTDGSYGSPTYDIYRWRPDRAKFVKDAALTRLASEHLGYFDVDAKHHRLTVYDKDGAAWHRSQTYRWRRGRLDLVQTEVDDATQSIEVITTRLRSRGHWHTRVRRFDRSSHSTP